MSRKPNSHDFNASHQTRFLFDAIPKRLTSAICVTCRISMRFIPLHHNTSTWRSTRPNANRDELKSENSILTVQKLLSTLFQKDTNVNVSRLEKWLSLYSKHTCRSTFLQYFNQTNNLDHVGKHVIINTYDNECISLE